MKKIILLIICLEIFVFSSAKEYLIRISADDEIMMKKIIENEIEIFHHFASNIDIILKEAKFSLLDGHSYQILGDTESFQRELAGYHDYEETLLELQQFASCNPDIIHLFSLGKSTCYNYFEQGMSNYQDFQYEVWCLKLSDNPTIEEEEPNIYYAAEIHAREPISLEVDLHILNYLVSNYGVVDSVTNWIDNTQIWFIPLINPDGHKLVTEGWHLYHRKNMRDNNNNLLPDYSSADGVDLNRNFGYVWGSNGTSSSFNSNIYNGPNAWSELETIYLRQLLTERKFSAGITYHSYGEWILYPLGHLPNVCSADHLIMDDLAVEMAATIPKMNGSGTYTPAQAVNFGYTCQGTMGDWGYAAERIFSFTIELANTFIPSATYVDQICADNLSAALIMLDRLHHSCVTGNIQNCEGEYLVAEIIVPQIDEQAGITAIENVSSDSLFGRYRRLLLPGNYTFRFEKEGFLDQIYENVLVYENSITELSVTLIKEFIPADSLTIEITGNIVQLTWAEEAFEHEVYSANSPDDEFLLETNGNFLSSSNWQKALSEDRRFFKVKRISR